MADEDEQERHPEEDADAGDFDTPLAMVGVGVCAASLASLAALFSALTPEANAAYLVAVRQKEGLDVGTVLQALEKASVFPATLAVDGERVLPDRVYVGAPDDLVTVENGQLRVRPATEPIDHRGALDSLLISLAEHAHERAVAVILSGLGSEGSAGIVATKKFGGLSIAEAADHGDLAAQGAADPAAVADLHLPIDRIAAEIARYVRNLSPILQEEERDEEDRGVLDANVTQVATILRNVTGHDFHGYKRGTFLRRIQRRIQVMQVDGGMEAYVERLKSDREEVQHLFQDLLIGVTQFFRDPAEFETLERELPRLFANKGPDDQFRVWVLGCATGEEAYSIAILLREHIATLDHPPEVQIFATDLDARALSLARAGRYAETIANHIRPDRLERWFVREGDTFCVSKELREMCIFSPHNIVKDAPFSRVDVLSCRNLLIYLSTDLQNRVIPIFHFSLRPDGVLFLGSSENVTRHGKLFAPIDRKSRVFRRLETATRIIPDFPLSPRTRGSEPSATQVAQPGFATRLSASVSRRADAVAERYAPAYVVVDTHGDVLHFSGRTGRYLEPSAGTASLSLQNLVHRDLRLDVRTALARATAEATRIEMPRLTLRQDEHAFAVNVIVEPLSAGDVTSLIVVFQDLGPVADGTADDARLTTDEHVQRLEAELRVTRDRLQATIEELESTNEELKSSNEEYQSINEELQSANEEMETSKEELQSVNEELQTVNGELGHRVGELGRTNSDLKNLLESTQIATVFLDNDLRVRNFTPTATDVFHLLDTDIGRPLDHVVSRVEYPELIDDVRRVLKTLVPAERQVSDTSSNRHFSARVLPYRSVDNYISGAVVTFTDLTAIHEAQIALRESDARHIAMADAAPALVWETDRHGVTFVNQHYLDFFGVTFDRIKGFGWTDLIHPEDREAYLEAYAKAFIDRQPLEYDIRLLRADGEYRWTQSSGRPLGEDRYVGLSLDITESKDSSERLREGEERLQIVLGGIGEAFYALDRNWCFLFASRSALERWGSHAQDVLGRSFLEYFPGAAGSEIYAAHRRVIETGVAERLETVSPVFGGWIEADISPTDAGGLSVAFRDIEERKRREAEAVLLDEIGQDLARLSDAQEIMRVIGTRIGQYFNLSGCNFCDVNNAEDEVTVHYGWTVERVPPLARTYRLKDFMSDDFAAASRQGKTFVVRDTAHDARVDAVAYERLKIGAFATIPFLSGGRWTAYLSAMDDQPREWRDDELELLREVSERLFARVQTARVDVALRESEQRQRALVEGIPQLVWRGVAIGDWTWASPQWSAYTGQSDEQSHGRGWLEMVHPDDRDAALAAWAEADQEDGFDVEYRLRRAADDSYRWFRTRATPVRDVDGAIVEWLGTSTDVDETRGLQKRQEVLVAELQHRVRNMLTVVRSVFAQTVASGQDLEEVADHFKGRLDALARTQVIVTRSAEGTVDLADLIRDEFLSVGVGEGPKLRIAGPDIALPSKTAESIGLALHELTTNAIKYGALKVPSATLDITWSVDVDHSRGRRLDLTWLEQGVPAVPTRPTREGFGRELIEEALPYRLGAETRLEFLGGGVRCAISVPLPGGDEESGRTED